MEEEKEKLIEKPNITGLYDHLWNIRTYTGKQIDVFNLKVEDIDIIDIAVGLSNTCRFGGQLGRFYSVAEHSIAFSMELNFEHKLEGLLHDAAQAYIGYIPLPIKSRLPDFIALEEKILKVIAEHFGLKYPFAQKIKDMDKALLEHEWEVHVLSRNKHIETNRKKVVDNFIAMAQYLIDRR